MDAKTIIAKRAGQEFSNGDYVNLGIGIPTLIANHLPENIKVTFHSENGFLGIGPKPAPGNEDRDIVNAGGLPVSIIPGGATFDSAMSFAIIRGGHLNITVLGALQVDEEANLANWIIPGKKVPGMGGAMDLVAGARRVIIAMEHTAKGKPKIVPHCTLPLTATRAVHMIVTDMAVFKYLPTLTLTELAPGVTEEQVRQCTSAKYDVAADLRVMPIAE